MNIYCQHISYFCFNQFCEHRHGLLVLILLSDLVQSAPELPDDLGKNTREMIALRCLEDFIAPQNGITSNGPSAEGPKVQFDLSESCEDVLQRILQEVKLCYFCFTVLM